VTDRGELERLLERERRRVDEALEDLSRGALDGVDAELREPMEYALSTSGKRLRPLLCVAAYRLVRPLEREVEPALYRLSCVLEIVHTYSLVHDDLPCMDDDDLRRGRPTAHRVFGDARALVGGAALLPLAVEVLLREAEALGIDSGRRARLVVELCRAVGAEGMVGGQLLDLEGERREIGREELEAIHRAKTGALLTASLRIGALAAGAEEAALEALTAYGEALGLAFQITDDVLDVVGDAGALGKTAGRDEALKKASYPSLFGIEGARLLARERADEAKAALRGVPAPELLALADFVVERER
jgi:geranylgeranyl diphosphate synthase type II